MTTTARRGAPSMDALEVLKADHEAVHKLFTKFKKAQKEGDTETMQEATAAICKALSIHAQIEEEIFYPAMREGADADPQLDEADIEHAHVKELVAQLESATPGSDHFEARVKVLSEYVDHHVKEEESTLFAKARKAECDLNVLGEQLLARKEELGADNKAPGATTAPRKRNTGREVRS
jgi:hemerythrin superfamily protein